MLTERQIREIEYHRERARRHRDLLVHPFSYDVVTSADRRWWNAYWEMFSFLMQHPLNGRKVLVVGCGFGDDALRLAKLGADVYAFDLSPESLAIARELALREKLRIDFQEMPAERLDYDSGFFDYLLARDILHHVDIPKALAEITRVSKEGAVLVANEIYSHTFTEKIRRLALIEKRIYPAMRNFIYKGESSYMTEDERKLTEQDIEEIDKRISRVLVKKYFNFLVNRLAPDKFTSLNKLDRSLLAALNPVAHFMGGRVLLAGVVDKQSRRER